MSEENADVRELIELLAKEKTLQGQYHGHSGQRRVAEREVEYWNNMLAKMSNDVEEHIKAKWLRNKQKAEARDKYHAKMVGEAKKELEKVRKRIREIMGGEEK